jgi:hypothetical protein
MNEIGIDIRSVEIDAAPHRTESGLQRLGTSETARVELKAFHSEAPISEILIAEAANFDLHCLGQFAREIADVHARAAIDVRRVFVGQEEDFHE